MHIDIQLTVIIPYILTKTCMMNNSENCKKS